MTLTTTTVQCISIFFNRFTRFRFKDMFKAWKRRSVILINSGCKRQANNVMPRENFRENRRKSSNIVTFFVYLLRCELNDCSLHTANVSHELYRYLHSCASWTRKPFEYDFVLGKNDFSFALNKSKTWLFMGKVLNGFEKLI